MLDICSPEKLTMTSLIFSPDLLSNSLIDLVVFGRAAAKRAAELVKPGMPHEAISNSETEKSIERFDNLRNGNGDNRTADLRISMQKPMQSKCAVFALYVWTFLVHVQCRKHYKTCMCFYNLEFEQTTDPWP